MDRCLGCGLAALQDLPRANAKSARRHCAEKMARRPARCLARSSRAGTRDGHQDATTLLPRDDDNGSNRLRTALLSFEIEQSDSCAPDSQQTHPDVTAQA